MIFGHQKNLKIFSRYLEKKIFPHAVLFAGPEKVGKRRTAIEISKYLLGNHRENFFNFSQRDCFCEICKKIEEGKFLELIEINPENQISIKEIREIQDRISLSSVFPYKIVILNKTEVLSEEAVGALLKVLEEPRGKVIFFLLTSRPLVLPKTILSRVEIFKFSFLRKEEIKDFLKNLSLPLIKKEELEEVIDFSFGRVGLTRELILEKEKRDYYNLLLKRVREIKKLSIFKRFLLAEKLEKENIFDDFLFLTEFYFRDLLLLKYNSFFINFNFKKEEFLKESEDYKKEEIIEIIKKIEKVKNYLFFSNVNKKLALEVFLLNL